MTLLGRGTQADELLDDVAAQLSSGDWYSTQSVAFALVAVAQNSGTRPFVGFSFDYSAGARTSSINVESPVSSLKLPAPVAAGLPLSVSNTSDRKLYVTAAVRATPASGEEDSTANGLSLSVTYADDAGRTVDVRRIAQGADLVAHVSLKNVSRRQLDNLALTQLVPAGWEIRNDRLENASTSGERSQDPDTRAQFWWIPAAWRGQTLRTAEYTDIRDDRLNRFFSLAPGESIFFETRINAAYLGRFYLPGTAAEAMYDATQQARLQGQWVEVVPGK
jgi:uncharacterized protein YfaS (alpha-2-macroglobulin family)